MGNKDGRMAGGMYAIFVCISLKGQQSVKYNT